MAFVSASPASLGVFVTILAVVSAAIVGAIGRAHQSAKAAAIAAGGLALWLAGIAMLVHSGRMATLPINGLPLIFGPVLLFSTALGLSAVGRRVAATLPLALLVGFQAFRLPLELVLHSWARQGTIPETMTWTGQNWDIVSGALALIAAPCATRFPAIVRITNIVGLASILHIVRVAIL